MDLCRMHVIDSWLLNSMITIACVVWCLIVISLGGCWSEVHWGWPLGKGRKLWIALVCIQDEKERQTLALFVFLFCLSWWFRDVTSLYIDCGRSLVSQGNWHCIIASRNVKASNLRLHSWAQIFFSTLCLGGMGNNFTILLVMDFTIWYTDIWIYVECMSLIPDC